MSCFFTYMQNIKSCTSVKIILLTRFYGFLKRPCFKELHDLLHIVDIFVLLFFPNITFNLNILNFMYRVKISTLIFLKN